MSNGQITTTFSWPELWRMLKLAALFALVSFVTRAIELLREVDMGTYKELFDLLAAIVLWLLNTWTKPLQRRAKAWTLKKLYRTSSSLTTNH